MGAVATAPFFFLSLPMMTSSILSGWHGTRNRTFLGRSKCSQKTPSNQPQYRWNRLGQAPKRRFFFTQERTAGSSRSDDPAGCLQKIKRRARREMPVKDRKEKNTTWKRKHLLESAEEIDTGDRSQATISTATVGCSGKNSSRFSGRALQCRQ